MNSSSGPAEGINYGDACIEIIVEGRVSDPGNLVPLRLVKSALTLGDINNGEITVYSVINGEAYIGS